MNEDSCSRTPRRNGAELETSLSGTLKGLFQRITRSRNGDNTVRGALEELIEEHPDAETPIDDGQRVLLENILNLRDRTISDVMVPRVDIVAINVKAQLEDIIALINDQAHSRVPVFQETLDDAIGMVHIKDVLAAQQKGNGFGLRGIIRPVLFVAPSMQVLELLLEMRVKRTHMALVVDEFGGVDGLLTIEDLVEEIVGEIEDEHDQDDEPTWRMGPDGAMDADARLEIVVFEKVAGAVLSEEEREEIDTLGGLVFSLAGRVPVRGELVKHESGLEIEVLEADPRRIKKLRVHGVSVEGPGSIRA